MLKDIHIGTPANEIYAKQYNIIFKAQNTQHVVFAIIIHYENIYYQIKIQDDKVYQIRRVNMNKITQRLEQFAHIFEIPVIQKK